MIAGAFSILVAGRASRFSVRDVPLLERQLDSVAIRRSVCKHENALARNPAVDRIHPGTAREPADAQAEEQRAEFAPRERFGSRGFQAMDFGFRFLYSSQACRI